MKNTLLAGVEKHSAIVAWRAHKRDVDASVKKFTDASTTAFGWPAKIAEAEQDFQKSPSDKTLAIFIERESLRGANAIAVQKCNAYAEIERATVTQKGRPLAFKCLDVIDAALAEKETEIKARDAKQSAADGFAVTSNGLLDEIARQRERVAMARISNVPGIAGGTVDSLLQ